MIAKSYHNYNSIILQPWLPQYMYGTQCIIQPNLTYAIHTQCVLIQRKEKTSLKFNRKFLTGVQL